jgi:hypothetical protein
MGGEKKEKLSGDKTATQLKVLHFPLGVLTSTFRVNSVGLRDEAMGKA